MSAAARQSGRLGRSTRHAEAVELLTRVRGTGELPFSLAVVLVCTCRRWDRVTAKLIAAIQDTGLLSTAERLELRHRDAAINGLLDAAGVLDEPGRRTLIDRALGAAQGSVRIAALEHLCELDGPETARHAGEQGAAVRS